MRDFTLASQGSSALRRLQRGFVVAMLKEWEMKHSAPAQQSAKPAKTDILQFATANLTHHFKHALIAPFCDDKIARTVLFHDDAIVDQVV